MVNLLDSWQDFQKGSAKVHLIEWSMDLMLAQLSDSKKERVMVEQTEHQMEPQRAN